MLSEPVLESDSKSAADVAANPRCLLIFAEEAKKELLTGVKDFLISAGFPSEVELHHSELKDWPPFLVVSGSLDLLEDEAERAAYLKPHAALVPHVPDQGLGKIEFRKSPEEWRKGYASCTASNSSSSSSFKGLWSPAERSQLLYQALQRLPWPADDKSSASDLKAFKKKKEGSYLLPDLHLAGLLESITPLDEAITPSEVNRKSVWQRGLYAFLAPCEEINDYFGSSVAMYFAWMNSFTCWLILPSLSGLLCFGQMKLSSYTVDDNPYLCFHSVLVVIWGAVFVRNWERVASGKAWNWGVFGEGQRAEVRPDFVGTLVISPATGLPTRHFSGHKRLAAYLVSFVVTVLMLFLAFVAMICSLNLQGYMEEHTTAFEKVFYVQVLADFSKPGAIFDPDQTEYFGLLTFIPTVLHVIVIMHLNMGYRIVAEWLTTRENHKYKKDHMNSLVAKRFLFEAFDCYISLFYIAFAQQDMRKLRNELISLYTVDSIRRALMETIIPLISRQLAKRRIDEIQTKLKKHDQSEYADALDCLSQPEYEQFDDFLEMVVELGYVILFADAFPLAALLTLATNLVEIKSDLFKLTQVYRRPLPERAAGIGVWQTVLKALVLLSIVTNVLIFVMSEQLASWVPSLYREAQEKDVLKGRVAQILDESGNSTDLVVKKSGAFYVVVIAWLLEHGLGLLVMVVIDKGIKPCPWWVRQEVKRTEYFKEVIKQRAL